MLPTAVVHPPPSIGRVAQPPPASRHHQAPPHTWLLVVGVLVLAVLIGLGIWIVANRGTSTTPTQAAQEATVFSRSELSLTGGVRGLQLELRAAGYSIAVNGVLSPVIRSAAGNYLRPTVSAPLDPVLASYLAGTVITGARDPAAWNARFGLNRATRWVERPLAGPGSQLDAFGNLRG